MLANIKAMVIHSMHAFKFCATVKSISFFSCYAGSGSFTRSGVNHQAGAKTPIAAIIAAVLLMLVVVFVAPLAAYLPIPAMGGLRMVPGVWIQPSAPFCPYYGLLFPDARIIRILSFSIGLYLQLVKTL